MARFARPAVGAAALGLLLAIALIGPARVSTPAQAAAVVRPPVMAAGPPLASGTLGHRLRTYFERSSTIALLAVLVVCSLVLATLRRRAARPRDRGRNQPAGEQ